MILEKKGDRNIDNGVAMTHGTLSRQNASLQFQSHDDCCAAVQTTFHVETLWNSNTQCPPLNT